MEKSAPSLLVRVVLGVVIGFGFVTPAVAAVAVYTGANTPLAVMVGMVGGGVVTALVITRMEYARGGL